MTDCPGCNFEEEEIDHHHEYLNAFGHCIFVTYLDGKTFQSEHAAFRYLRDELGFDKDDSLKYLRLLRKKYN